MPYLYHNFIWVEMAGIQRTSSPPLRFNGKYSSKMHEELPKTRRSAFVIKNNNTSASMNMGGKVGIETQGPWEDRNAQKLIDFVGKIKDRRNSVYSLSIPELEGMTFPHSRPQVDVWAVGVLAYLLIGGQPPYLLRQGAQRRAFPGVAWLPTEVPSTQ